MTTPLVCSTSCHTTPRRFLGASHEGLAILNSTHLPQILASWTNRVKSLQEDFQKVLVCKAEDMISKANTIFAILDFNPRNEAHPLPHVLLSIRILIDTLKLAIPSSEDSDMEKLPIEPEYQPRYWDWQTQS